MDEDGTPDGTSARGAAAAALRGLAGGVGRTVSERVRQELDAAPQDERPSAGRVAAAAVGGLVTGVGQNVSDLVRQELGAARTEVVESALAARRGAGLLGGAAVTGQTAVLFLGVAAWRGLGNRIGFARSALVVAAVSGTVTALFASRGLGELGRVQVRRRRTGTDASAVAGDEEGGPSASR